MNYLCMRQIDEFHIDYFKRNELHQKVYIKLYDYIFMIFSKKKKKQTIGTKRSVVDRIWEWRLVDYNTSA